jgi:hypothetical protein
MTDISKCSGKGCLVKSSCYRFTAPADPYWQAYFTTPPVVLSSDKKRMNCGYYWGDKSKFDETIQLLDNG